MGKRTPGEQVLAIQVGTGAQELALVRRARGEVPGIRLKTWPSLK